MEDYNPEEITESLNDYLELNSYQIFREGKKKWFIAAILVFFGFLLLALKINFEYLNFLSDYGKKILEEAVDITAWVFIWEAVTVLFLSPSDLLVYGIGLLKRINVIKIGSNDNTFVQSKEDIIDRWQYDSKGFKFARVLWLVSSVFLMALASSDVLNFFVLAINGKAIVFDYVYLAFDIIVFLLGLSGILAYIGKNKLHLVMKVFGVLLAILAVTLAGVSIYIKDIRDMFIYLPIGVFSAIIAILPKRKIK